MKRDNTVIFKGGKNGIIVHLDEEASLEDIKTAFREKMQASARFFADAKTTIAFKGKEISQEDIVELVGIVGEETDLLITFVDEAGEETITLDPECAKSATGPTYHHKANLRSGQSIFQNGSVVIMGNVNSGAEVIATGNVYIFGTLGGMVHAGSDGDEDAYICALAVAPSQIRIGSKITYFTQEMLEEAGVAMQGAHAFIKDEQIHVDFTGDK